MKIRYIRVRWILLFCRTGENAFHERACSGTGKITGQCYEAEAYLTLPPSLDGRNCLDRGERFKSDSDSDARNGDKYSACRKRIQKEAIGRR